MSQKYLDSICIVTPTGAINHIINSQELMNGDKSGKAIQILKRNLDHYKFGTRDYSIHASILADIYKNTGDKENYKYYLVRSAISDIRASVKKNMALLKLATTTFKEGDIEQANRYLKKSISDANYFSARMRKDNSGNVLPEGGTDNPKIFILDYGDKLGGVYDRMSDADIRKAPFSCDETGNYNGMFLIGRQKNRITGEDIAADADRDKEPLVYVDQVGTFLNLGRELEVVMTPRWGETNSGIRVLKYPIYPASSGLDWRDIDEVEFRLSEVYYTLAECKMRSGDYNSAKSIVNDVRYRYFSDKSALEIPGPGFNKFDEDWMLSEWGIEFLNEGRRRRTDLRRFDKFTQGQWWFFGRASETDRQLPAKRDRKYEWYPIPQSILMVNSGLRQTPHY